MRRGFPLIDLRLGMQMHAGARRLLLHDCAPSHVSPLLSVLPGCGLAIPFTRIYLYFEMDVVCDAFPMIKLGIFVDDAGMICVGDHQFVMKWLIAAARAFVRAARRLR